MVAGCRAVTPGSSVPGLATPSLGLIVQGPTGSGDGADAVDGVGEFLCPGPGFGDPQDQAAGVFDQASRGVQKPAAQARPFGLGQRAIQEQQPHPAQQVDGQGDRGDPGGVDRKRVRWPGSERTQAKRVLRWFRDDAPMRLLAAEADLPISTSYRYLHEAIDVIAEQASPAGRNHLAPSNPDTTDIHHQIIGSSGVYEIHCSTT